MSKWLSVFEVGEHNGKSFTKDDLLDIANNFTKKLSNSASKLIVPFVKGHPELDDAAYGWTDQVRVMDNTLQLIPKKIDPEFQKESEQGKYPHISVRIKKLIDGTWDLVHIGFLGAKEPALNLPQAEFKQDDNEVFITCQFSNISNKQEEKMTDSTEQNFATELLKEKEQSLIDAQQKLSELEGEVQEFSKKNEEQTAQIKSLNEQTEQQNNEILEFKKKEASAEISIQVNKWSKALPVKLECTDLMLSFNKEQSTAFVVLMDSLVKTVSEKSLEKPLLTEQFSKEESNNNDDDTSPDGINVFAAIKRSQAKNGGVK